MFNFKDIVVAIKMVLNGASVRQVVAQMQQAMQQASNTQQAQSSVGGLAGSVVGLGKAFRTAGIAFMTYLGGRQLINFLREATSEFIKFDRGLQRSISIMEGVNSSMRTQMSETALQVSIELNIAATDIGDAY